MDYICGAGLRAGQTDMESKDMQRQVLRKEMGDRRASLSALQIETYSNLIAGKLMELEPLISARNIMGFASVRNEVDLRPFLQGQADLGKTILLPRVEKDGGLAAVEFSSWESTRLGAFGIAEPVGSDFPLAKIDAVIVPGLVFDAYGYRLGYGKGYYDRFLKLLPKSTFICGVCYEFQVVDNIIPNDEDVPMHWIVTEKSELVINWDFF